MTCKRVICNDTCLKPCNEITSHGICEPCAKRFIQEYEDSLTNEDIKAIHKRKEAVSNLR